MKYLHNNLYKMCSYFYIGVSASLLAVSTSVFAESASEQIIVGEQSSSLVQDVNQQKPYNPKDKQVAALQTRLIPYLKPSENIAYYQAIKALTWLSYAAHEGSEKSLSSARTEALQQAKYIIDALEQGQIEKFTLTTAILSDSSVMRRDLWANAELLKQTEGFSCAQAEIAQAEVMLVWAAAEHCELGWRHSRELFLSAQSLIDQSNLKASACKSATTLELPKINYPSLQELNGDAKGCHGVKGKWPIWSPEQKVVTEPLVAKIPSNAPNVVHFALDQSNLSKESIDVLNQVVTFLKDNPTYTLTLYGFTDARASEQYNLKLSMRRAQSVLAYLQQQGIHLDRVAVEAKGKNQTINDENQKFGHALSRRVELVYVDPEGKEVSTFKQRQDLQVEK
ncbi:OmpA family protein [Acinetobacter baumannii]|nr:OmpA family protein [Acinetobacter sp. WCHA39]AZM38477.1 OmpA family protein [Acinetobacter baumannii]